MTGRRRRAVVDWVELLDVLGQEERFKLAAVFDPLENLFVEVWVLEVGDLLLSSLLIWVLIMIGVDWFFKIVFRIFLFYFAIH